MNVIECKTFELRDVGTFIPAVGIRIAPREWAGVSDVYLARRAGYGEPLILLVALNGGRSHYDPYDWESRTWQAAHLYIAEHWTEIESGSVIDVQFILGESDAPKLSERETEGELSS